MAPKPIHLSFSLLSLFAVAILLSLPSPCFSEQSPSYMKFTVEGTEMPQLAHYDYIIVGGGTAGCPLAATLSKYYKVLLLERGGVPYGNPNLMTEEGFHSTLADEVYVDDLSDSPAEHFISSERVPNARGRVLGGSSAIGAGFYSRADRDFYEKSGINWDIGLVNESYRWVEKAIVFEPKLDNWQSAVRSGFLEANIGPNNGFFLDHQVGTKIGGSTFDRGGRRHSAADLLNYAIPSNIRVAIHATVETLTFATSAERPSANGVVYLDKQGIKHVARLLDRGEVLLSAGALGSPQLLQLSGVGNRLLLSSMKTQIVRHHPYVGHFLYDSPRNGISIVPSMPLEQSLMKVVGITSSGVHLEAASNVLQFNAGFNKSAFAFVTRSEYPVNFTVATLMEKVVRPLSFGFVLPLSNDIKLSPVVSFNYFNHPDDLEKCVNGIRKIHEVLQSRSMEEFKYPQSDGVKDFRYVGHPLPADLSDDDAMQRYCRHTVSSMWDYHGGCVVGKVVNQNFRVFGIDALRVVDGSIFTVSPGTNPQATVLMLGRYVGMKILKSRSSSGGYLSG